MLYHGVYEDEIEVVIDTTDRFVLVQKRMSDGTWVETLSYRAPNLVMLSENFRDGVGYGPAVALLTEWEVPHESPLWTLGHKGGRNHFTGG